MFPIATKCKEIIEQKMAMLDDIKNLAPEQLVLTEQQVDEPMIPFRSIKVLRSTSSHPDLI